MAWNNVDAHKGDLAARRRRGTARAAKEATERHDFSKNISARVSIGARRAKRDGGQSQTREVTLARGVTIPTPTILAANKDKLAPTCPRRSLLCFRDGENATVRIYWHDSGYEILIKLLCLHSLASLSQLLTHTRFFVTLRSPDGAYHSLILFRLASESEPWSSDSNLESAAACGSKQDGTPSKSRQIYVMEASCPHLGADMSHADIEEYGDEDEDPSIVAVCPWHR